MNLPLWTDYISAHPLESKKSAYEMNIAIQDSDLEYKALHVMDDATVYTKTLQIPKIFSQKDKKNFESICSMTYQILAKVTKAYKTDPKVQRLFRFSPALHRLVQKDPLYETVIPMLRVDIFYNEETGDFKFCEFNTDGTSAMFENDTMHEFLKYNNAWNALKPEVEYMNLMDPWADAFLEDFFQAKPDEDPSIVITDILENAYLPELYAFERLFQSRGISARVVDIRNLEYDGKYLVDPSDGMKFNAVYRRAVTRDVMEHIHDLKDFVRAVYDNNVVCIGDFQTQIAHSKAISEALKQPEVRKYLSQEEQDFIDAHLPASYDLTMKKALEISQDKDKWIIKPKDGYGAKGVWAGVDVPASLWKKLILDCADMGYIVQEYIPHYKTRNIDLISHDDFLDYSNLTGLYVYNGKFAGVYSRLSDSGIISTQYNERMVPTLFALDEKLN